MVEVFDHPMRRVLGFSVSPWLVNNSNSILELSSSHSRVSDETLWQWRWRQITRPYSWRCRRGFRGMDMGGNFPGLDSPVLLFSSLVLRVGLADWGIGFELIAFDCAIRFLRFCRGGSTAVHFVLLSWMPPEFIPNSPYTFSSTSVCFLEHFKHFSSSSMHFLEHFKCPASKSLRRIWRSL